MNLRGLLFIWILHEFHNKFATGKNVLVLMPMCMSSHLRSFVPLVEELIRSGHNVTVVSHFPMADIQKTKHTHVHVQKTQYCHSQRIADDLQHLFRDNIFTRQLIYFKALLKYSEEIFNLPELQHIINSQDHFDLVMAELFFMDAFFAFGYKFKAPVVALCPIDLMFVYAWILGNPYPSSHIPNTFLQYTEKMSLLSRISNSLVNLFSVMYYEWVMLPKTQKQMEKFFNFDKNEVPNIKDILKNISLVLVNSHYSFGYVKPELPNIINIAGLHHPSLKPLPQKIKTFMDEANDGVIYVSLGSIIEPQAFVNLGNTFIEVLKNYPQRIVMKWDQSLLTEIPKNILVEKWISQTEVLNHPNCRLFISHGGMHSTLESVNASVPVLGVPFFGDQLYNMAVAEHLNIGRIVPFTEVSKDKLSSEINEILNNPEYKENSIKRSKLFQDRLAKPLDEAMYWVEHVMKHKSTTHLKSAAVELTWYQYYAVDVFVILIALILATLLALKLFIAWILKGLHAIIKHIYPSVSRMPESKVYKGD